MANPNTTLIQALRETALRLKSGATYAWGHHGVCNCGNLLQVLTNRTGQDILAYAHTGVGEWTELAHDYCGVSAAPVDLLISTLLQAGLNNKDIHDLEYLENREVLDMLPGGFRWLRKNRREDVIVYFETYADLLEQKLAVRQTEIIISSNIVPQQEDQQVSTSVLSC